MFSLLLLYLPMECTNATLPTICEKIAFIEFLMHVTSIIIAYTFAARIKLTHFLFCKELHIGILKFL